MSDVTCTYTASGVQGAMTGTLKLTNCNPPISNDDTLGSLDVIIIVAGLVVLGLIGQYIMHHINRKAVASIWDAHPSNTSRA